jgi:glycine hydroxymethyltransferase
MALSRQDPNVFSYIQHELDRQQHQIELIASENIVSRAVLEAQGSILTNKYAEGYPHKRYYGGCEFVDAVEDIAIDRLKKIFNCAYANVQPHSGSQANQGVMMALLEPGDTFMGLSLDCGGHLTHGSSVNQSGKWFKAEQYGIDPQTHLINYDALEEKAIMVKPKLIIAGGSAYSRIIDFKRFREICDKVGAYLMVDMAHFAGLVAGGVYPSPVPYADVITSTTHKTLRGPRGGIILSNNLDIGKKINSAIFPGLQGGPLMHVIAAKAVAFGEILTNDFKEYAHQIVKNAKVFADTLTTLGYDLVSGGTDSHLILVDLRCTPHTGATVCEKLEEAHITCNKNGVPNDPRSPMVTSGIRVGTPAGTTRGFKEDEFIQIAHMMHDVIQSIGTDLEANVIHDTKQRVIAMCEKFPIYG